MNDVTDMLELRDRLRAFAHERDWEQFHTTRNLILALVGEVGELAALVQWLPDEQVDEALSEEKLRSAFADEMADCLIYLLQIADRVGVDLGEAAGRKLERNAVKYPVELSRGRSIKYTQLANETP